MQCRVSMFYMYYLKTEEKKIYCVQMFIGLVSQSFSWFDRNEVKIDEIKYRKYRCDWGRGGIQFSWLNIECRRLCVFER